MAEPRPLKKVGVMQGSRENLRWTKKAQELQVEALPTLRASAEKWTASLIGILGAVGLAALLQGPEKFSKLDTTAETVGKGAFFVAAVLAIVAIAKGLSAAHVSGGVTLFPTSGSELKKSSEEKAQTADDALRYARRLAAGAVVLIFVSAGALWWGGAKDSKPQSIELRGLENCAASPTAKTTKPSKADVVVTCRP